MHDSLVGKQDLLMYEDYLKTPDDGRRYEILDGVLHVSGSPYLIHQRVLANLMVTLATHTRNQRIGEIYIARLAVVLQYDNVVEPDIMFISNAKLDIITDQYIHGVPTLLVEILSESSRDRDMRTKRGVYARSGVDWYWIVDPDGGTLLELQRVNAAYAESSRSARGVQFSPKLFPGLTIDMNSLWE